MWYVEERSINHANTLLLCLAHATSHAATWIHTLLAGKGRPPVKALDTSVMEETDTSVMEETQAASRTPQCGDIRLGGKAVL